MRKKYMETFSCQSHELGILFVNHFICVTMVAGVYQPVSGVTVTTTAQMGQMSNTVTTPASLDSGPVTARCWLDGLIGGMYWKYYQTCWLKACILPTNLYCFVGCLHWISWIPLLVKTHFYHFHWAARQSMSTIMVTWSLIAVIKEIIAINSWNCYSISIKLSEYLEFSIFLR